MHDLQEIFLSLPVLFLLRMIFHHLLNGLLLAPKLQHQQATANQKYPLHFALFLNR
jgi:hypothetical protein